MDQNQGRTQSKNTRPQVIYENKGGGDKGGGSKVRVEKKLSEIPPTTKGALRGLQLFSSCILLAIATDFWTVDDSIETGVILCIGILVTPALTWWATSLKW